MPLTRSLCAADGRVTSVFSSGPGMYVARFLLLTGFLLVPLTAQASGLTLNRAISKALSFDPRLKSERAESAALNGETYQGSLSPNPELSVDLENFLGSGGFRGFGGSELTLGIDQRFELGGKRAARIARGQALEDLATAKLKATRRAIITQVAQDFYEVLGAAKKLQLRRSQKKQFGELLRPLKQRVEAGGSPEADLIRGQIAAEQAEVALETAILVLDAARQKLAANWSGYLTVTTHVRGHLVRPTREAMALATILVQLKSHPALRRFKALHATRLAELDVQESQAIPDLTLGLGVRRLAENDDFALLARGSIPIPVRNRNEGAINAAAERIGKAAYEKDVVWQVLKRKLITLYGVLHRNCHETKRYARTIVPKARSAVKSIKQGYFRGRFKVVDLLDAISVSTQAESRQSETLMRCQIAALQIKTLTGIDPLNGQKLAKFAR